MYKNFKEALEKEQLIQLGNIVERKRLNYLYADWQYWQKNKYGEKAKNKKKTRYLQRKRRIL